MAFDVEGARSAGYSDAEIADHLATSAKFDAAAARKAGYSDAELVSHLAGSIPPAAPPAFGAGSQPLVSMSGHEYSTGHVGEVAAEAWRTAPKIVPQEAIDQADRSGVVGHYLTSPLLQIANAPLQLGNALFRGGQEFVQEALSPVSPQLGRDVAAAPEAFFGSRAREAPELPTRPDWYVRNKMAGPEVAPPGPAQTAAVFPPRAEPPAPPPASKPPEAAPVAADIPTITVKPEPAAPEPAAPPEAAPARNYTGPAAIPDVNAEIEGIGADITREPIPAPNAKQVSANFQKDVTQTPADRAGPQNVDHNVYVEGATRTEAAREFSTEAATHEQVMRDTDTGFDAHVRKIEEDGKRAVTDAYQRMMGDGASMDRAIEARQRFSPDALGVFDKETPVDGSPPVVFLNRVLASRTGKRDAVSSILESARDGFLDADGKPETLPSMLYGGRQNITDILDEGRNPTGNRKSAINAARKFLTDALGVTDETIGKGAPLFTSQFLPKWAEYSKPIERMEFLQGKFFGPGNIKGPDGLIQYRKMQNLLERMVKMRMTSGNNPAKAFDAAHLDALVAMRNEMGAWWYRDDLAATRGSPTYKRSAAAANLDVGPVGKAIRAAADIAAHGIAFGKFPVVGNALYQGSIRPQIHRFLDARNTRALEEVKQRMLETQPRDPGQAAGDVGPVPIPQSGGFVAPPTRRNPLSH